MRVEGIKNDILQMTYCLNDPYGVTVHNNGQEAQKSVGICVVNRNFESNFPKKLC